MSVTQQEVFILSYFTQFGEEWFHGTLSLIQGVPRSTWTIAVAQDKKHYDTSLTEDQFRSIWDRVSDIESLREFAVNDPEARLSFADHYIISIVYKFSASEGIRNYMIPHKCKSNDVAAWIQDIENNMPFPPNH